MQMLKLIRNFTRKIPKPQLGGRRKVKLGLESKDHLVCGIMVSSDIFPNAFRRPGAMTLDMLQGNV